VVIFLVQRCSTGTVRSRPTLYGPSPAGSASSGSSRPSAGGSTTLLGLALASLASLSDTTDNSVVYAARAGDLSVLMPATLWTSVELASWRATLWHPALVRYCTRCMLLLPAALAACAALLGAGLVLLTPSIVAAAAGAAAVVAGSVSLLAVAA